MFFLCELNSHRKKLNRAKRSKIRREPLTMTNEVQVYRMVPTVGKYYKAALATRSIYIDKQRICYTTNPLIYMGKFVKGVRSGFGDGTTYYEIYDLHGKENRLDYDYDGNMCLLEVSPQ